MMRRIWEDGFTAATLWALAVVAGSLAGTSSRKLDVGVFAGLSLLAALAALWRSTMTYPQATQEPEA